MKPQHDKYDFAASSGSKNPGFICFEKNGGYYFHLNDEMGDCILYSQSYQSAKSRNNGIRSVKKNAPNPDMIEKGKTSKGKPYFLLRAGNHQEIGRSGSFKSIKEMEAKMKYLASVNPSTTITDMSKPADSKPKKVAKSKSSKKPNDSQKLPKYSFRVDWYPESQSGKIEHIVSGETQKITDLSNESIIDFITSYLPETKAVDEKVSAPVQKELPKDKSDPRPQEGEVVMKDIIRLKINGEKVKGFSLPKSAALSVELNLKELIEKESQLCSATILAKSLKTFKEFPIRIIECTPSEEGYLSVPVFTEHFESGAYRLIAHVQTVDSKDKIEMTDSRLIHVW